MQMRNAKNSMLCWNPESSDVAIVPYPDTTGKSKRFSRTGLAVYSKIQEMSFSRRKMMVFIEAMHLIIRDKCDPMAVHNALLELQEYYDGCADDMPCIVR